MKQVIHARDAAEKGPLLFEPHRAGLDNLQAPCCRVAAGGFYAALWDSWNGKQ